jgi:hypothetical protein
VSVLWGGSLVGVVIRELPPLTVVLLRRLHSFSAGAGAYRTGFGLMG